ncbi:MAG: flagellar protein FlaG [Spirochaetota bacterium]
MEVSRLQHASDYERHPAVRGLAQHDQARRTPSSDEPSQADIESIVEELDNVSRIFNRKLKFSIDRDLNDVVVKIIDTKTDKVIKELPPEAMQRLHVRIRETLGLLFDKTI